MYRHKNREKEFFAEMRLDVSRHVKNVQTCLVCLDMSLQVRHIGETCNWGWVGTRLNDVDVYMSLLMFSKILLSVTTK